MIQARPRAKSHSNRIRFFVLSFTSTDASRGLAGDAVRPNANFFDGLHMNLRNEKFFSFSPLFCMIKRV